MGIISITPPTLGQPNATEDADIVNALTTIQNVINGNLDAGNLADEAVTYLKTATGATGLAAGLFRVTKSADQVIAGAATSKVTFNTEAHDLSGWFDSTTNHRFTPLVAGYYRLTVFLGLLSSNAVRIHVYKNGSSYQQWGVTSGATGVTTAGGTVTVQANGTTDYFEVYATAVVTSVTVETGRSYFEGELIGRA